MAKETVRRECINFLRVCQPFCSRLFEHRRAVLSFQFFSRTMLPEMLAEERRFQIREILTAQRTVSASELCDRLKVTAATIRRDLAALEQEGVLVRSHGGAVSRMSSTNFQPTYGALLRSEGEEKREIARGAEQVVLDRDTSFSEGRTLIVEC